MGEGAVLTDSAAWRDHVASLCVEAASQVAPIRWLRGARHGIPLACGAEQYPQERPSTAASAVIAK